MKIIIIGSGIAGRMAAGYFKNYNPEIYEARCDTENIISHKAIIRFKDESISNLINCKFKKINITKEIYYRGNSYTKPSVRHLNEYSIKTNGTIDSRSIKKIDEDGDVRYIIDKVNELKSAYSNMELVKIKKEKLFCAIFMDRYTKKEHCISYDILINTIPLNKIIEIAKIETNISCDIELNTKIIFITRYKLNIPCYENQTIYFPDIALATYRATIEFNHLIIESVKELQADEEMHILSTFGIQKKLVTAEEKTYYEYGKISKIDELKRRRAIIELTKTYNIYSLGRSATAKQKRADDLIYDLNKIDYLIKTNDAYFNSTIGDSNENNSN